MVSELVYKPNIPHLKVGYNPFTNHLLTSWDIQVARSLPSWILDTATWKIASLPGFRTSYFLKDMGRIEQKNPVPRKGFM